MLTTEVVKGLLAGKVYRRKGDTLFGRENFVEIKIDPHIWKRQTVETTWRMATFAINDLRADWEEVIEWQEIDWKEAVDCHNEGIPLQRYRLGEWIDAESELNLETLGFVCNSKWRKKVEVKDA